MIKTCLFPDSNLAEVPQNPRQSFILNTILHLHMH